ncbi:hypothetical protein WA026_015595 [Henosepilachna vigintioctopunctata]|uniref:Zinc finger PHD-type domain-containing protein n=1 Tax=Henosepilachna vigintioctopunctata TaxID=420089 RepID=A0AAW1VHA6_9CUCU
MDMLCSKCNSSICLDDTFLCDCCGNAFHEKCINLPASEMIVLKLKRQRALFYFCDECLSSFKRVPLLLQDYDRSDINHLKNINLILKRQYSDLKMKLEVIESQLATSIFNSPSSNSDRSDMSIDKEEKNFIIPEIKIEMESNEENPQEFSLIKEMAGSASALAAKKNAIHKAKKIISPKVASPKVASPKVASPKVASPKVASPKVMSPKLESATSSSLSPKSNPSKSDHAEENKPLKSTRSSSAALLKITNTTADSGSEEKTVKSSTLKVKIASKPKIEKKQPAPSKQVTASSEEDSSMVGKKVTPRKSGKWAQNSESSSDLASKPCQPCSIRCEGVQGLVPTLQCRLCLCLYHNECVGMVPNINIPNYICKNCQLEQGGQNMSSGIAPPPLTPITALQSVTNQPTVLPKLQRIPKSPENDTGQIPDTIVENEKLDDEPLNIENNSILGHVTSWLPQNSRIQVDNQQVNVGEAVEPARPQYVEYLAGRKFLIIPKYNVVSVSPTVAAARSVEPSQIQETIDLIPGQTADVVSNVKTEPISPSKPENSHTADSVLPMSEPMEIDDNDVKPVVENTNLYSNDAPVTSESSMKSPSTKKKTLKLNNITNQVSEKSIESKFMENYLQNLSYGYNTLLYVFQYLKVQDLLRAGCVCTMWRDIASHSLLWRTVRMKNSQVHSFEGLSNTLQRHGTVQLDLRKMLLTNGDEIWPEFSSNIGKVETLRKIELCRCPASVVEKLTETNRKLEVVNAVTIRCETINLEGLANWTNLRELRLKSTTGLNLASDIDSLKCLSNLKILSLTSIRELNTLKLDVISELTSLESLDLGECTDFPENFGKDILTKLTKLEKLRLEKGQGHCHTFEILDAVRGMPQLEQLELVNFDIKAGFDKALGACKNIKKLLIIPTYISQSATTNHMVLGGVLRLQKSLSHFVWGVTLELLRVTELFVDQCEEPDQKEKKEKKLIGNGDSIPVLKPVPLITDDKCEIPPALDPPQVEILALPGLQKLLLQSLPTTRVKILKIPFHATWRQSITDAVN